MLVLFFLAFGLGMGLCMPAKQAFAKSFLQPIGAQDSLPENADEISVSLSLTHVSSTVVPAILIDRDIYMPIMDVLDFVKIKSELSADRKKITGFFIDESDTYVIDLAGSKIDKGSQHYVLNRKDLIVTETGSYMRSDLFKKAFGLTCEFNFNLLDVKVSCDRELPAVSDALRKRDRRNMLPGSSAGPDVDRTFPLLRNILSAGVLDWAISSSMLQGNHTEQYTLGLGGDLFGGDIDARYSGNSQTKINWKTLPSQLPWRWRYVTPESDLLTVTTVGTISSFSTAALSDSVVGFQISNKPVAYRNSFANYTINDRTEPNWMVELYVNESLVKYVKADNSGYYSFAIPIGYGSTNVKLKFYGPWGEVQTKAMELRIPYTFLPPGNFEYSLTAGTYKNDIDFFKKNVAQLNVNAGVTTKLSVGAGVKYFKEAGFSPFAPFASASMQLLPELLVNGQYIDGAGLQGTMSYSSAIGLSIEAALDHPFQRQRFGALISPNDQRRLTVSTPLSFMQGVFTLSAFDVSQTPISGTTIMGGIVSMSLFGVPVTFSANASFQREHLRLYRQGLTGATALSIFAPLGVLVRPNINFDFAQGVVSQVGLNLQRGFLNNGQIALQLQRDIQARQNSAHLDIRYTLPFMQVGAAVGNDGGPTTFTESAQGSVIFDKGTTEFVTSDRNFIQHAGIMIRPFLDENNNGLYDRGEPIVKNFKVAQTGGRLWTQDNGIIRIVDLEPYTTYTLRNSTESVENLAWVPRFETYNVTVDANSFREVNIPVTVAGQIGGYVKRMTKDGPDGQGGIRLKIRSRFGDQQEVKMPDDFLTYSTGEFYNIGLAPGKYQIYPDRTQLERLRLRAEPLFINFELKNSTEGDILDTLNFTLNVDGAPSTPPTANNGSLPTRAPEGPSVALAPSLNQPSVNSASANSASASQSTSAATAPQVRPQIVAKPAYTPSTYTPSTNTPPTASVATPNRGAASGSSQSTYPVKSSTPYSAPAYTPTARLATGTTATTSHYTPQKNSVPVYTPPVYTPPVYIPPVRPSASGASTGYVAPVVTPRSSSPVVATTPVTTTTANVPKSMYAFPYSYGSNIKSRFGELRMGMSYDKALLMLGKSMTTYFSAPVVSDKRTISDSMLVGHKGLIMRRTITFDNTNAIRSLLLTERVKDLDFVPTKEYVLAWLTTELGNPTSVRVIETEKAYTWQLGDGQLSLQSRKSGSDETLVLVTFIQFGK
jgi:hypothetical protein